MTASPGKPTQRPAKDTVPAGPDPDVPAARTRRARKPAAARPGPAASDLSETAVPDTLPPDALPPDALPPDALPPDALPPDALPPDTTLPDDDAELLESVIPGPRWSDRNRVRERELLQVVCELPGDDPDRIAARDELVTMHLPLASFLARRFRDRGESLEDLEQVATIGLIKAVDRFDLDRGVEFSTFATPTMVGEIKRHFRDKGWAIRVPRRLQELRLGITRATAELSQTSGRSPTVADIAAHLGVSQDDVLEGLESAQAYATLSLDATAADGDDSQGGSLADTLGDDDPSLAEVEARATLNPLLASLPPRERRIVHMRFFENMTQSQIAEQVGVSQMHVSRLLAKSLAQMRVQAEATPS